MPGHHNIERMAGTLHYGRGENNAKTHGKDARYSCFSDDSIICMDDLWRLDTHTCDGGAV